MDTAWMASLYNSENKFICGGTLITNLFVLTAGHCLVDKLRFVRLGEKDRSCKTSNCEVVREYTVSRVIPHPRFRPNFFPIVYDIGLIKLNETVDYNDSIRPICIIVDSAVHFPNNIQGRAYGWGKTNSSAQVFSDIIMSITLTRTRQKNCSYLPVKNDQFCAVSSNGGDTCTGDSGGPLAADYVYQGTKSYVQIGIVSFGSPNCNNKGVYTNVESYQDWIVEMVEKYNDTLLFEECSSQMHGVFAVRLWEVSLRSTIKGTLITDRFVLTVARDLRTDATTIIARIKDSYVSVLKIDKHPDYSPSKPKRNNIALLELAQKNY
ncbi:phenoloxidase-activating enzyme-like [Drosophila subpulchrella]|uniref:phenoloxidase-activating enzyme-like n=1 Tax=Drosophila subpulchrella TaxID=1486046 RepID=UPI0018A19745|nr:phenoloxidase-activating enzyme-like [Drosophila subpulchrella]